MPREADADVLIVSKKLVSPTSEALKGTYHSHMGSLRPAVLFTVFVRQDLWDHFIEGQS